LSRASAALLAAVATFGCAVGLLGCGAAPAAADPTPLEHPTREALCAQAKERGTSLLVLAKDSELADLEGATKRSIAVVKFDGCELRVMPACQGLGVYLDGPPAGGPDTRTLASSSRVFEAASIGAPPFFDDFERGAKLEVSLVPGATRTAAKPPAMATGDCDGATHWVKSIHLGAFTVGLHPADGAPTKELARHGSQDACAAKPDASECRTPYAVELEPMRAR
jgi:hypothetical protein